MKRRTWWRGSFPVASAKTVSTPLREALSGSSARCRTHSRDLSDSPVRVLGVTVPAGLEGMFQEQGSYFAQLTGPPDEEVIAAIGKKYGVTVVGPPLDVGDE